MAMKNFSSPPPSRSDMASNAKSLADGALEPLTISIEALGAQGDGVARIGGSIVHVPFTLPGETVRVQVKGQRGNAIAIETPSPARIPPICRHFGVCGGCAVQHLEEASYAKWKAGLVTSALAREGIEMQPEALRSYATASRRRATFTAEKRAGAVTLGYKAARAHETVNLVECPVLLPEIEACLPIMREALHAGLPEGQEARVHVTAVANGVDCAIEGPELRARAHADLIAKFSAAGMIRAIWNGDIVFQSATPVTSFGGIAVPLPPGSFLQAVEACEQDMGAFALEALAETKASKGPVCDLFSGLGAFTFRAARLAPVTAYEANSQAVAAMTAAIREAKGIKPVTAVRRDLFRNPLGPLELNKFAAAIIDPPREGAEAQCQSLSASKIATVVMLSCNPGTFARDARHLLKGGFQLSRLAAFDQFKFSAHVEIGSLFHRSHGRRR
jgi:23S rRNA (uracil1939-C5)-methyltransferase